jgi:hypothetical protein
MVLHLPPFVIPLIILAVCSGLFIFLLVLLFKLIGRRRKDAPLVSSKQEQEATPKHIPQYCPAIIFDEIEGRVHENIDESKYTPEQLGRLWRYRTTPFKMTQLRIVKRDKNGNIEPVAPQKTLGDVLPEEAAKALQDPDSAAIYTAPTGWPELLAEYKLHIIAFVLIGVIFILSFTFTGTTANQVAPIVPPGATPPMITK